MATTLKHPPGWTAQHRCPPEIECAECEMIRHDEVVEWLIGTASDGVSPYEGQMLMDAARMLGKTARLRDALKEIAGYQGDDSALDTTAQQMRQCARDVLAASPDS